MEARTVEKPPTICPASLMPMAPYDCAGHVDLGEAAASVEEAV